MNNVKKQPIAEIQSQIRDAYLFQGLSPQEVEVLIGIMELERFEAGAMIMREGEQGDAFYILMTGTVEISKALVLPQLIGQEGGTEKALIRLSHEQHPILGEMSMLEEDAVREASIKALTECTMLKTDKRSLQKLLLEKPEIGTKVYRNIASELVRRLRKANRDVLKLTTALSLALQS